MPAVQNKILEHCEHITLCWTSGKQVQVAKPHMLSPRANRAKVRATTYFARRWGTSAIIKVQKKVYIIVCDFVCSVATSPWIFSFLGFLTAPQCMGRRLSIMGKYSKLCTHNQPPKLNTHLWLYQQLNWRLHAELFSVTLEHYNTPPHRTNMIIRHRSVV
jgi:hypothetical protein